MKRRRFLQAFGLAGAAVSFPALAACGDDDAPAAGASPTTAGEFPTAAPSPSADAPRTASVGELRTAERTLTTSLDPDTAQAGFTMTGYGMTQTLMRISPQFQAEPWLATGVTNLDPLSWRVALRDDVTFWDGSRLDAAAVKASLERSTAMQANTADLLPTGTTFAVEGADLVIKTPRPVGALPLYLAAYNFTINKEAADGSLLSTGPFRPSDFVDKQSVVAKAYEGYRGGPPRLKAIRIRSVTDVSARVLALQAGDVDLAASLLPSHVAQLQGGGFEVLTGPTIRQNVIALNLRNAPLDDVVVRRAFALCVDREALVAGVLDGVGTPAEALVPENVGIKGLTKIQRFDLAEANGILDAAGWTKGGDGIREKDGQKLQFRLANYASRAELKPLSIAIKDMARAAGFDLELYEEADITTAIAENQFDAAFYAYNTLTAGDLSRVFSTFWTPGGMNRDRYENAGVTAWAGEYAETIDEQARIGLLEKIQAQIALDVPVVHVNNAYDVIAFKKSLKGFFIHPLENYKYHEEVSLDA